jgi:uncharacterized delta-60 repeat protein
VNSPFDLPVLLTYIVISGCRRRTGNMRSSVILLVVILSALLIGCGPSKHRPIDVYLTVESEYGSPNPPVGSNYLNYGMTITASVAPPFSDLPGTRYVCTDWTGTGSVPSTGTENSCQFIITENSTITWTWKTQYFLTTAVSPLDSGSIIPAADWYDANTVLSCNAIANAGYEFSSWSGDLSGTDNPQDLAMDAPKSITANFILVWAKSYGGANADWASSIQQTSDGGYIVAGYTESFDGGALWVLKLNGDGTVSWQKRYGGAYNDEAYSIQQTIDGGYTVAGCSYGDFWVLKLNTDGAVSWQKRYGGAYNDEAYSIQQISDGGYIVAGYTDSFGADYDGFCVLKLNSDGTVSWQKTYSGADCDYPYSIQQTSDGGYILAGTSFFGAGGYDFWVLKLNSDGEVSWQKRYGGAGEDFAYSIYQTSDGGYVVAGTTPSFGAGDYDFWVLKLTSTGAVSWQKRYGGTGYDVAYSIQQTSDGGYIVAGYTDSFVTSSYDFWVLKLNSDGTIPFNPASGAQTADTNAVPVDTNCTVTDTTAIVTDTSATVMDTNATVVDTNATVEQQAP